MKKIILIVAVLFSAYSCVNDSDDYRKDSEKSYKVPAQYLFSQAEKGLIDLLTTPNYNRNVFRFLGQYWTETTYYTEVCYDFETRKVPQNFWDGLYLYVLGNLAESRKYVLEEQPSVTATASEIESFNKIKQNKLAQIELLEVYTYQVLVDTYGNVPYSEAGDPFDHPTPKYDDAKTIYDDLISRTKKATAQLDSSEDGFGDSDFFYRDIPSSETRIDRWKKIGNTLLVKLGIALSDVNPTLASETINNGINGGVILSNQYNAIFKYDTTPPNFSTLYENLVASGRNDFVAADTFVDFLNSLNDLRRSVYFQLYEEKDDQGNATGNNYYKGGKYGYPGNTVRNASKVGTFAYTTTTPGVLFDASEVNFYLAEAAARGFIAGSPESYYNAAITQSFEYWGVPIGNYLSTVPYDNKNWQESIGKQAWIALYNRIESWNTKRRLDYPVLKVSPYYSTVVLSVAEVPVRFRYPIDERTVNSDNYYAASNAIGGDHYHVKIFWDVK
ncbi:MAG: SusD/RagB family nutrient-binding outer membrane lipoprotein [Flavobacteriaceae bacterium]|jgi:hypothetical protein|nr:SusD/RagB family nutrient-binding outer membrane lipoprotein [Flavobacteriaceae bacterium]